MTDNTKSENHFINLITGLINDIEAMQDKNDPDWFGEFPNFEETADGMMMIEWPNLAIMCVEIRKEIDIARKMELAKLDTEIARLEKALVNEIKEKKP